MILVDPGTARSLRLRIVIRDFTSDLAIKRLDECYLAFRRLEWE